MNGIATASMFNLQRPFWTPHRGVARNWLALGVLLAAWNSVDEDGGDRGRPAQLRAHPIVSVRAAQRANFLFKGHKNVNEL